VTALDYLAGLPYLPASREKTGRPSKAELRRWCRAGSVLINGWTAQEMQAIPNMCDGVWQLVFFPQSDRSRCHMVQEQ